MSGKKLLVIADRKTAGGNYMARVQEISASLKPSEFADIDVVHDDWCSIWRIGVCSCNPTVTKREAKRC